MSNTSFHLNNKTILVTGASSGIGKQVAISASRMGATVIITGRNEERLNATFKELETKESQQFLADLQDSVGLELFVEGLPDLDGIVHCVGIVKPFPIKYISIEKINETFDVNYNIQLTLMAQIARKKKLKRNASIVFSSSISAAHPHKGGALYAGSKAALEIFSKTLVLEFSHLKIRSNCLASAMVKTPMYDYAQNQASKEQMDKHVEKYPLGVGLPDDVANAAIFLLSDASRWITGQTITLDGGFLLGDF
jgi:NAD(P)-dependent dehydrogenase (short-subunit alcohol dehydrogenase family)